MDRSTEQVYRGLREILLLAFSTVALFVVLSLVTFNLEDTGWRHSGSGQVINNAGGRVGAWISDFFLSIFGIMAYLLPIMIGYHGYILYKGRDGEAAMPWILVLRWIGFAITLISGTAMAYTHFLRTQLPLPGTTGGILGEEVAEWLIASFGIMGASLLMLATFFAGLTLFTGISWVNVIDLLGKYTLNGSRHLSRFVIQSYSRICEVWAARKLSVPLPRIAIKPRPVSKPQLAPPPIKVEPILSHSEPIESEPVEYFAPIPPKFGQTKLPPITLLDDIDQSTTGFSRIELEQMSRQVEMILADFGVEAVVVAVLPGPVITRFEIEPAAGVKVSRISALSKDLARAMSVPSVRIVEVIPGKSVIGLEIPNVNREIVSLRAVCVSKQYKNSPSPLTLVLGKDIAGTTVVADLGKMPHLLVAGTTGSGKSVAVNAMILSLLYKSTPDQVRLILIDPKMLELSVYEGIPHLLTPVVTDMKEASNALRWCVAEMERRYRVMSMLGVRNLEGFNRKVSDAQEKGEPIKDPLFQPGIPLQEGEEHPVLAPLPNIVIVIDELADMMMIVGKKVEESIARLAQKARAAGLHLILATQRPSVDVLTGLIKANIPTRLAFQVSSKIDSRTILDQSGAENLLGNGDMLFLPPGTSLPLRAHGAFVSDHEVHRVVDFIKSMGTANYLDEILKENQDNGDFPGSSSDSDEETDPRYDEAVQVVTESRKASISYVQRRLKVGYNRAARMMEDMEAAGVVSGTEANGNREVLAPPPPED